jgi:hypothetical protein
VNNLPFLVVASFVAALSAPSASAYLWETQAQIEGRYDPAIKTTGYPDRAFHYVSEGLKIKIKFFNGVSEAESYSPSAENVAFGDGEIRRLLESNSAGAQWREEAKFYDWVSDTRNGRAYANVLGNSRLDVYTHASIEREDRIFLNSQRTLKDETFEGIAALSQEAKTTTMTIHSGGRPLPPLVRGMGLRACGTF